MDTRLPVEDIIHTVKNEKVGDYLESEHRNYAIYTLQSRAIPYFNGLKPVQQRCLWKLKNGTKYEKVAKLTGQVMSIHPHGDASISDSINQMAGPYCNNVQFFSDDGAMGTKINPTAFGSPRYVSAKVSNFSRDCIFKDWEIVRMIPSYDETDEEPKMLLPLIPILLLNGIDGIATAYSTTILPRDIKELIDEQIKVLKGKEPINPIPYSKPIDNRAVRDEVNPNKYQFLGDCEIVGTSKAKITKLPYGLTHLKFIKNLTAMKKKGQIVGFTDKSKKDIDIVVDFKKAAIKNKKPDQVVRKLKLTSSASERITVLDPETSETVMEYSDASNFIKDYTEWRLKFYPKRYRRLINLNLNEMEKLRDIVIAIDNNLGGKAKEIKNKNDLIQFIKGIEVNNVDYISSLPVYRFTEEEYEKAQKRITELEEQNKDYDDIVQSVDRQKEIYINELKDIKKRYSK